MVRSGLDIESPNSVFGGASDSALAPYSSSVPCVGVAALRVPDRALGAERLWWLVLGLVPMPDVRAARLRFRLGHHRTPPLAGQLQVTPSQRPRTKTTQAGVGAGLGCLSSLPPPLPSSLNCSSAIGGLDSLGSGPSTPCERRRAALISAARRFGRGPGCCPGWCFRRGPRRCLCRTVGRSRRTAQTPGWLAVRVVDPQCGVD